MCEDRFGLLHISNILSGAEFMRVLPQIAYSVLGGMGLAALPLAMYGMLAVVPDVP